MRGSSSLPFTYQEDEDLCICLYGGGYIGENEVKLQHLEYLIQNDMIKTNRSALELSMRVTQVLGAHLRQLNADEPLDLTWLFQIHPNELNDTSRMGDVGQGKKKSKRSNWSREMDQLVCVMAMEKGCLSVSRLPFGCRLTQETVHHKRSTRSSRSRSNRGGVYDLLHFCSDYEICWRYNHVLRFILKYHAAEAENGSFGWLMNLDDAKMIQRFDGGDENEESEEYNVMSGEEPNHQSNQRQQQRKRKKTQVKVEARVADKIVNYTPAANAARIHNSQALIRRGESDSDPRVATHDVAFTRLYNFLKVLMNRQDRCNLMQVFTRRRWVLLRAATSVAPMDMFEQLAVLYHEIHYALSRPLSITPTSKIIHLMSGWPEHECFLATRTLLETEMNEEMADLQVDDLVGMLESLVGLSGSKSNLAQILGAKDIQPAVVYTDCSADGSVEPLEDMYIEHNELWDEDFPKSWDDGAASQQTHAADVPVPRAVNASQCYQKLAISQDHRHLNDNAPDMIAALEGYVEKLRLDVAQSLPDYDEAPPYHDSSVDPIYYRRELGDFSLIVWNPVDDEEFEPFTLMKKPPPSDADHVKEFMIGCDCIGDCFQSATCFCASENLDHRVILPYTGDGLLCDAPGSQPPPVTECNARCSCSATCGLRKIQNSGGAFDFQVFRTSYKGWGIRTLQRIEAGSYVLEYLGELVDQNTAHRLGINYDIQKCSYLFDLDAHRLKKEPGQEVNVDGGDMYTIDAKKQGGIARFINHSCDPNLRTVSVWWDTVDFKKPHLTFFATRDILPYEELCFDYQYEIDPELPLEDQIKCHCGANKCKKRIW